MRNLFFIVFALTLLTACQSEVKETPQVVPVPPITEKKSDRFEKEIQKFEALDKELAFQEGGIVFTGSSSIRMWSSLEADMADYSVLNRGFGGATIPEVLDYADRYLWQHKPQIIVFYCGENDISEGASTDKVVADFKEFVRQMESKLVRTKLVYISMKPSSNRWDLYPKYLAAEKLIKDFIDQKENIEYMDSSVSMMDAKNTLKEDIFIEDGLHMNAKGYEGWTQQLLPILEKIATQ